MMPGKIPSSGNGAREETAKKQKVFVFFGLY
jgi:hypothetical protein